MQFSKFQHAVGKNVHHLEWCPKYRYNIFRRLDIMNVCVAAIRQSAARHGIIIMEITVLPNHVHAFVELPMDMSPCQAMQLLKGGSAFEVFRAFPNLRKRYPNGHLWSKGYMAKSVGDVTIDVVKNYVRNQYEHHGIQHPEQAPISAYFV
ncbi:MAG: IS200/IS605 family transposase [Candidatus Aenigmatarchaeota archaeon]